MTWFPLFSLVMVLFAGGILLIIPRFSRPDIYFAVTVDPAFRDSEAGRAIARRYTVQMTGWIVLAAALIAVTVPFSNPALPSLAVMVVTVGSIVSLVLANRRTRPHAVAPDPVREASLTVRENRLPGGWIVWVLPFAILAAAGVYLNLHWEEIPDRFPVHFGMTGQPDRWASRTPAGVYGSLGMGAAICLMMSILGWAIQRSRRISLRGAAAKSEQSFRALNVSVLLVVEYLIALLFAAIPIVSIFRTGSEQFAIFANAGVSLLLMVILMAVFFRYGQGGTRLAGERATGSPPIGDRTPDECWKWGLFYYNPDDPAIMVEKRFGIGYTMNFGNARSWLVLIAILALPLAGVFLFRS
jgi:uncharacterized membrane protein